MTSVAHVLVAIATIAAAYVGKLLVVDVAWADHRLGPTSSTARTLAICCGIAAVIVAIPLGIGGALVSHGHPGWAIVVALGSLVLSGAGFVALAGAFKP